MNKNTGSNTQNAQTEGTLTKNKAQILQESKG